MSDETKLLIFMFSVVVITTAGILAAKQQKNDFELKALQLSCVAKKG